MNIEKQKGIYAITDCENCSYQDVLEKSEIILQHGCALFQYRDKKNDPAYRLKLANELKSLCSHYNVPFIINDNIELAKQTAADGIHLGRHDQDIRTTREQLGNIIIGASCYNDYNRALSAKASGADYIAFGAFYPSSTKPGAVTADLDLLVNVKKDIGLPVVAIGGITPENGKVLIESGANYIAVISGLYSTKDTAKSMQSYINLFTD